MIDRSRASMVSRADLCSPTLHPAHLPSEVCAPGWSLLGVAGPLLLSAQSEPDRPVPGSSAPGLAPGSFWRRQRRPLLPFVVQSVVAVETTVEASRSKRAQPIVIGSSLHVTPAWTVDPSVKVSSTLSDFVRSRSAATMATV